MLKSMLAGVAAIALLGTGASAQAQQRSRTDAAEPTVSQAFAKFAPRADTIGTRLDFAIWNDALHWFVLRMGHSLREAASRPEPVAGSRIIYGHDSPYRLEGNRVAFSYMTDEVIQSLTDYRRDLEELPDKVPLNRLSRNEQLAYWINLHNVAVIEQIALAYPINQPVEIKLGDSALPLDETPFITVSGVRMSPKDIRTKIVYPNWDDPKVIYGFWRGEIGGPSIERDAYTGANVGELLDNSAREFVNSLRGTQKSGDTLLVSHIFREAQSSLFPDWPADLRRHLRQYGEADVIGLLDSTGDVDARIEERDIADLAKGEREPDYSNVLINDQVKSVRVQGAIVRLMAERSQKFEKIIRRGDPEGRVTVLPGGEEKKGPVEEVK